MLGGIFPRRRRHDGAAGSGPESGPGGYDYDGFGQRRKIAGGADRAGYRWVSWPAGAATSERDVLLATKLNVPGLRPDLVPRPRLAQRLDEGRGRGPVLACAPAGYGKTVLLAEWVRRGRHPVAWLSLDAGDNDPARFWRHTVAALDRVRPGISDRMGPLLGPPPPPSFEPLVTALINEAAGQPDADEALLLVLDDYHLISSQPVHESLGFLLEHRPPGLHLALTSRSDPPLALARLRARGQLTELRAADLRFTPGEAAVAAAADGLAAAPDARRGLGAPLPDAVAAALAARTEGWAAGLQLAGLSLRGHRRRRAASSPRSPAATATSWTTWPRRCWSSSPPRSVSSCSRPRYWSGSPENSATRSPGGPAARRCWNRLNGPGCSSCRWMRCAAGGVTTTCSPTCSAPACSRSNPAGCPGCTGTRPRGTRSGGWLTRRSGTRPGRRGVPPGPPG